MKCRSAQVNQSARRGVGLGVVAGTRRFGNENGSPKSARIWPRQVDCDMEETARSKYSQETKGKHGGVMVNGK